jgi:hypothetical protein
MTREIEQKVAKVAKGIEFSSPLCFLCYRLFKKIRVIRVPPRPAFFFCLTSIASVVIRATL